MFYLCFLQKLQINVLIDRKLLSKLEAFLFAPPTFPYKTLILFLIYLHLHRLILLHHLLNISLPCYHKKTHHVWDQMKICMKLNHTAEDLKVKFSWKWYWIRCAGFRKVLVLKSFLLYNLWQGFICYIDCNIGHL